MCPNPVPKRRGGNRIIRILMSLEEKKHCERDTYRTPLVDEHGDVITELEECPNAHIFIDDSSLESLTSHLYRNG